MWASFSSFPRAGSKSWLPLMSWKWRKTTLETNSLWVVNRKGLSIWGVVSIQSEHLLCPRHLLGRQCHFVTKVGNWSWPNVVCSWAQVCFGCNTAIFQIFWFLRPLAEFLRWIQCRCFAQRITVWYRNHGSVQVQTLSPYLPLVFQLWRVYDDVPCGEVNDDTGQWKQVGWESLTKPPSLAFRIPANAVGPGRTKSKSSCAEHSFIQHPVDEEMRPSACDCLGCDHKAGKQ